VRIHINRILALAMKEFLHIIHDVRSIIIIIALPVIQLIMFGFALNMEIENIELAVIDFDNSRESKNLVEQFDGSTYFQPFYYKSEFSKVDELFRRREARAILIINKDFAKNFQNEALIPVQILIDASDANAATLIQNYSNGVINEFNQQYSGSVPLPFEIKPRIWYNPDMKSAYFFVPGLIALILVMISALLTSITITREKEMGTMEQILVSPVRPIEIIFGKVLPYIIIAFMDGFLILALGILLFGVPFSGSVVLLILLSTLYITTALSLGLMISTVVKTQQVAMMAAVAATLLPTIMLSGFIFPIKSMPLALQLISYIVPAKYYIIIIRGIMLKGNTFIHLATHAGFLLLMTVILLRNALSKFSLTLEK